MLPLHFTWATGSKKIVNQKKNDYKVYKQPKTCGRSVTDLPALVMIISVPASWNFFHSSLS